MLPLGGFALAIFAGWALPPRILDKELSLSRTGAVWLHRLLRYVVPAGIAAAALDSIVLLGKAGKAAGAIASP